MESIFIIEKAKPDNLENDARAALEWEPYSYTSFEEEAALFVNKSRTLTKDDSWVIGIREKEIKEYRYYRLIKKPF